MNPSEVTPNIRELIVHLNRKNGEKAQAIADKVNGFLDTVMKSGEDPASGIMQRAQQTKFAMEEVRFALAERNFTDAVTAARDAAKEWK